MFIYLNGDQKFLTKFNPISKLTSAFLFEQSELTAQAITFSPADVKGIICVSNRANQASFLNHILHFLKKPWLTDGNKHLLFDYVQLLKNIRKLWLTEKTELIFDDNRVRRIAK